MADARHAAENAARHSYGRLVAWLAWRWRDLAAAEDALADALLAALETWPVSGVPAAPDAWLLTVAKRNLLQRARHERVVADPRFAILFAKPVVTDQTIVIPDARLRLLFVCAHPAIDERARTPLMLQSVLGLDAARIAEAFGTEAGVAALARVPEDSVRSYQPYWVARATLLARAGDADAAARAYGMALGLSESPSLRAHLERLQQRKNR